MIFFTKFFYDFRDFSDFPPRYLREEVMLDLFIEATEELSREPTPPDISRGTRLEIEPGKFSDRETVHHLDSEMIHHKDVSESNSDDNPDSEKYENSREESKMQNQKERKSEKKETHTSLSKSFFLPEEFIRFDEEIKVDENRSEPK